MFKNEKQLRKLMRDCSCKTLWWIEPNLGSSDGLPDCFTLVDPRGELVFAELKRGWLGIDGVLKFEVRRAQRDVIGDMMALGADGAVVVAQIGGAVVHVFSVRDYPGALDGAVDLLSCDAPEKVVKGSIMGCEAVWNCYGEGSRAVLRGLGIG